jgi:hypothetical protein
MAVEEVSALGSSRDKCVYFSSVHQDICPGNILCIPNPSNDPHDVTFKLVDFGTSYIKKHKRERLDIRHENNFGNGMYCRLLSFCCTS